jgi:exodeoxyribonuclease V alpha subunit
MEYFSGRVHTVVYEDPPNAFYILKVLLDEQDNPSYQDPLVTVKGHVPGLLVEVGTWFGFEANWVHHSKFGPQLSLQRAPVLRNGWDPETAERMLVGYGVGALLAKQIRQHFGDRFVTALGDQELLTEVNGVDKFSAQHVMLKWASVVAHFKALEFLNDLGLPNGLVRRVWSVFEDEAIEVLSKNPWALVQVDGIKFEQTDEVARRLGLELDCPERIRGAVLYVCKNQRSFGHLYLHTGGLFTQVRVYVPNVTKGDIGQALVGLHKDGLMVLDKNTRPGTLAVYEPWHFKLESESARMLVDRTSTAALLEESASDYIQALGSVGPKTADQAEEVKGWGPCEGDGLGCTANTAVTEWGELSAIKLTDMQAEGVVNALTHPVSVLTGLPGTGKTTSLRAAVSILQDAEVPFLLCAPTGIAAKRLTELTGAQAYTIHRAFSATGTTDEKRESRYHGIVGESGGKTTSAGDQSWVWEFGPGKPHPADVVIVDEASMVDQHLLFRLLDCTKPTCRLVFVGDHAQLPSVGPGNVLREMIGSGHFPVVRLTDIFRQDDTSDIVFAAHDIHAGNVPKAPQGSDFVLVSVQSEEAALATILKLAEGLYLKRAEFQILSPRHAGTVGVTNLNAQLRELLNPQMPGLQEVKLGKDTIREDDRVMVVRNNYNKRVFNGDVGKISRVNRKDKKVEVKVFGKPDMHVDFKFNQMARHIRLAYACTVHKAQGLEYDVIVMPLMDSFRHQLQRNLLYTAVTRARRKVVLVGTHSALAAAVVNDKEDRRNTLFFDRLEAEVAARQVEIDGLVDDLVGDLAAGVEGGATV